METKFYYCHNYYDTFEDALDALKKDYSDVPNADITWLQNNLIFEETRENDDFSPWGEDW